MKTSEPTKIERIDLIGCGGVASYLIIPLIKLLQHKLNNPELCLHDGDYVEERNLERQFFTKNAIGKSKAQAMTEYIESTLDYHFVYYEPEYFHFGKTDELGKCSIILSCVDNHPARKSVLESCDQLGIPSILAGNEYTSSDAFFYDPSWKGTAKDPRSYFPEIATDQSDDPIVAEGCTGHAVQAAPQLCIANYLAAGHMLHLLWYWTQVHYQMDDMGAAYGPVRCYNNVNKFSTSFVRDYKEPELTEAK